MSFGFSPSDLVVAYQLAYEIHYRCFTKVQRADVKYFQFGSDINHLGQSLKRLNEILTNANDQRPQGSRHDDDTEPVTDGVVNTLLEILGDFLQTLQDCERLLSDKSKFSRSASGFIDNVAWHSSTERDVNNLRDRVRFHMLKLNFIAKPFEIQLLLGVRRQLQQPSRQVVDLRGLLDWDSTQQRHAIKPNAHGTYFSVPESLSDRFRKGRVSKDLELSHVRDDLPLKEGLDALVYHFAKSTVNFKPYSGLGQDVPAEQYLNLVKSRWILERLKESIYFVTLNPESLYIEYLRELEGQVRDQLVRFQQGDLDPPSLDVLSKLPDNCYSILVDADSRPSPAAQTEHRPFEEKVLEPALQSGYSIANLAATYRNQGRWDEAEKLEVQVMETRKRVLKEKHPSTLSSMANLASTYRNQGRWKEPEELEVRMMETTKRVLGEEHPDTLTSMANLASLLDKGADVNAQGGEYCNALQAASVEGHDQVVQTLLDKGADVNAQGGLYGNALQAASYGGHDQVVQTLLDKGADVNAQGGLYGNALQAASYGGHEKVVTMLLDKGADVNAQGGEYGNALQAASSRGHENVVQMLLRIIKQREMSMIFRKTFMEGNTFHATRNLDEKSRFVYHCFWELPNTMRTQFESGQRLSQVMTLTGSTDNAQAATCEDFISQFWPTSGSLLLKAIEEFLISVESSTEKDKHERSSRLSEGSTSIEIRSVIKSSKDLATEGVIETRITVDTSLRNQYDIAGSLAWLAATIRTSKNEALTKSKVQFVFQDLLSNEADASYRFILEPLEDSDGAPLVCWHPLFVNAVLAVQFPIAERTHGYGIEISPFLMARLAGIIMPVDFLGGYILKGLSTALIPMEEFEGDGAIQWHFLLTESTEDVIKVEDDFFKVKDVQTLMERKAYLGWCKVAKVLLGTDESNIVDVGWSDLSPKQQRIELSGFSLGVASSGMGIFGPSASVNFTLASNCRTRFVDTKQPLQNRLKLSVVRPVLLYDTSEKRAWLVPTVCILLHMMHLRSRELSKHHKPSTEEGNPDMPLAKTGGDSADEAYKVLTHFLEDDTVTSLGSSEIWTETLARFYICLDMALNESMKMKETSSSRDTTIFGFELMDIVLSESPFRFTERKVRRESGGWTKLARDVGYVLFCSGLGNAIMPGTGGNELCRNWSSLPSNFDYLAAYIPCLIDVLQRQGWHKAIQRLQNTTSGSMLYRDCNHLISLRCQHLQQYDFFEALQNNERNSDGVNSSHPQRALSKENIGAVVFGKITRLQKSYPENFPATERLSTRHH